MKELQEKLAIAMEALKFVDSGNDFKGLADVQKIAMFHNNNLEVRGALRKIEDVDKNGDKK